MSPGDPPRPRTGPSRGEIIVEFVQAGGFLRCTAVDVDSGTEASATGPVSAGKAALERIALGKLKRALARALN
ncbi:MAG: hypothetical protein KY446_11455 [Proteobacteria bacterium]|nr:hypothetical protein [Pseudomonadota bacterium]